MPKSICLHIGGNKTGSSAIQHFIGSNTKTFRSAGFAIPDVNLEFKAPSVGMHVASLQRIKESPDSGAVLRDKFEALMSRVADDQILLVSGENLSNPGWPELFKPICAAYPVTILLYIRRQDDLIASSWQQWASKASSDFDAWLLRAVEKIGDWDRIIREWEKGGAAKIDVGIYDRETFTRGDIRIDFLERLGLGSRVDAFRFEAFDPNPSYSDVVTDLVAGNTRIFSGPHDLDLQNMLAALNVGIDRGPTKVSLMSKAQRDAIMGYFDEKNRRVRKRFFPQRERLFKAVDHSKYEYLSAEDMTRRQMNFLLETMIALYKETRAPKRA